MLAAGLLLVVLAAGCTLRRQLVDPGQRSQLDREAATLKAHMRNGELYVLDNWWVDEGAQQVHGDGSHFDAGRSVLGKGPMLVPLGEVVLFETDAVRANPPVVAALSVVTVASALVTAVCLTHPKSCFGSCPTFYVGGDPAVAAEAFSASVAPALEARDVDALFRARPVGRTVRLRLTNEALETHVIREADLLVAPRPRGGRVLATAEGQLVEATDLRPPVGCRAAEGDCRAAVSAPDEQERASPADERDLATRETIELAFAPGSGRLGLVIEARQTFITTFLFYQALAYTGRQAGAILAALGRDAGLRGRAAGFYHLLGDIEVEVPDGWGGWTRAGAFAETGPIARDVQVVPLPPGASADRVRLRLTRGHWRLGYLALAQLGAPVAPVRVRPTAIHTKVGGARAAADWVAGRRPALVTGPGDEHEIEYTLPEEAEHLELFLAARGYYLEWIRESWLAEESSWRTAALLVNPAGALRDLAPAYKRIEPDFERLFWSSRYVHRGP
jgi:hypothetical protein